MRDLPRRISLCALIAVCAFTISADAREPIRCTILADDFEPRPAKVTGIDADTIQYVDANNVAQSLPLDRIVRLEGFPTAEAKSARPSSPPFMILLRDGQRWTGTPGKLEGDDLEWNGGAVFGAKGETNVGRVPLKSVVAIAMLSKVSRAELDRSVTASSSATQDELRLTNGDVVTGVLSASDEKTVTAASPDGQSTKIDWHNVRLVKFAAVAQESAAQPPALRLKLRDGRVVDGDRLVVDENQAVFHTAGGGRIDLGGGEDIASIERRGGGRVRMLASVLPESSSQSPFFPASAATPGTEQRVPVTAIPVTIGKRTYAASILARPKSLIRWSLDDAAATVVTRYAIPSGRPLADVSVRILLDEKVVHERLHLKSGESSELLKFPVNSAKSVGFEVDYGDAYDVQDDFYWLDPAILTQ